MFFRSRVLENRRFIAGWAMVLQGLARRIGGVPPGCWRDEQPPE